MVGQPPDPIMSSIASSKELGVVGEIETNRIDHGAENRLHDYY
jgi:hypothetical protein